MHTTRGTLLNVSQLFTNSKHINMDHTKSFIVREYNFKCRVCTENYSDPIILDCPCKCILCKKCLKLHWEMEIHPNDFKSYEVEISKKCLHNYFVSVNKCVKATGLSKVMEDIE